LYTENRDRTIPAIRARYWAAPSRLRVRQSPSESSLTAIGNAGVPHPPIEVHSGIRRRTVVYIYLGGDYLARVPSSGTHMTVIDAQRRLPPSRTTVEDF